MRGLLEVRPRDSHRQHDIPAASRASVGALSTHKHDCNPACAQPTVVSHALLMPAHTPGPRTTADGPQRPRGRGRRAKPAHGSRLSDGELRLVRLQGPESTSCPRWCRGRHRLNVEPARTHGALSGRAGTCDGRKEPLRLLQQARSTRGARGSPDRLGRGEGREEGEGGA